MDWAITLNGRNFNNITQKLRDKHIAVNKIMESRNPIFENMWYGLTTDRGRLSFANMLDQSFSKTFGDKDNKHSLFSLTITGIAI